MVWGLGVGYVISGNYFGWNLGLQQGGTIGLAIAIAFVIVMYVTFTYSYAELACAIPKAGGAFDYASKALGKDVGFVAGMAQIIEFVFAPPAIALAIGSYMNLFFPAISGLVFSIIAYFIFTGLNIYGVKAAAMVELVVTAIAVCGLLLFAGVALPNVSMANLTMNGLPHGISGIFAAIPFAIWFFLGIEGIANLAEETVDPKKTMSRGFLAALFTLILLCFLTFVGASGISGWEAIVVQNDGTTSDSPLPMALEIIHGTDSWTYTFLVVVGLFGLVASFHGLMLAAGRASFEFGKINFPKNPIGKIHTRFQTPANALFINMTIGIVALFTGRTGEIITIAVIGALTLYCISMVSVIALRRNSPHLERPFRVPFYPVFPLVALGIAVTSLIAVTVYNMILSLLFVLIIGVCFGIFRIRKSPEANE